MYTHIHVHAYTECSLAIEIPNFHNKFNLPILRRSFLRCYYIYGIPSYKTGKE